MSMISTKRQSARPRQWPRNRTPVLHGFEPKVGKLTKLSEFLDQLRKFCPQPAAASKSEVQRRLERFHFSEIRYNSVTINDDLLAGLPTDPLRLASSATWGAACIFTAAYTYYAVSKKCRTAIDREGALLAERFKFDSRNSQGQRHDVSQWVFNSASNELQQTEFWT